MKKVVIAGGSGAIGKALVAEFASRGFEITVLSRSGKAPQGANGQSWDGKSIGGWASELEGAQAVINLCGESVMQRWTESSKKRLLDSRVEPTRTIGEAISACKSPPKCWINASAVGFYGDTGSKVISEGSRSAYDFLGQLCQKWEDAQTIVETPGTQKTAVRIGFVIGKGMPFYEKMKMLTKMALGGSLGTGKQYVSWIHISDLVRLFSWAVENNIGGVLNGTAPNPEINATVMKAFRRECGIPIGLPAPVPAVEMVCQMLGWNPEMLLGGTRAVPAIPLARGFQFQFETIESALMDLLDDTPQAWKTESEPA